MPKLFLAVLIFSTIFIQASAQTPPVQNGPAPQDEIGVKIYENYKNCVVDISTEASLEDGQKLIMGGSGFFIDEEGHLVTNAHVVKARNDEIVSPWGAKTKIVSYSYWVTSTNKNKKYKAELVGINSYCDLALLKAVSSDPKDFTIAKLGDSTKLKVGEKVYALGMPLRLSNTFTGGRVSALHRHLGLHYVEDFIQTDAAINPGNSGSPLINADNEVVGINGALIPGANGIGFAIPVKLLNIEQLKKGEVTLPWFGLETMMTDFPRTGAYDKPGFKDLLFLHQQTGIDNIESLKLLARLTKDCWTLVNLIDEVKSADGRVSPAKKSGFKKGDLIAKINGESVKNGMDIRLIVLNTPTNRPIMVELIRTTNGVQQDLKIIVILEKPKDKKP